MSPLLDTSFLCALYRTRPDTERAEAYLQERPGPLHITGFTEYEFIQGVRFEVFRHRGDHTKGFSELEGMNMLARFETDLERGAIVIVSFDSTDVLQRAKRLSEKHTLRMGCRAFDILHLATALSLGVREFLTFDTDQQTVAQAEGLAVPL